MQEERPLLYRAWDYAVRHPLRCLAVVVALVVVVDFAVGVATNKPVRAVARPAKQS